MKALKLIIVVLLFTLDLSAQFDCDFVIVELEPDEGKYQSNDPVEINKYWSNGQLKLEFVPVNDSTFYRYENYENGKLKTIAQLLCIWAVDTIAVENIETGEFNDILETGYRFLLHGNFLEVGPEEEYTVEGSFRYGSRHGEWIRINHGFEKIVLNYQFGLPIGEYFEYYDPPNLEKELIKWKGQFKIVEYKTLTISVKNKNGNTTKYGGQKVVKSVKFGKWIQYSRDGKIIKKVKYKN